MGSLLLCLTLHKTVLLLSLPRTDFSWDDSVDRANTTKDTGTGAGSQKRLSHNETLWIYALKNRAIISESFSSSKGPSERELLLFGAFLDDRERPKWRPHVRIQALMWKYSSKVNHTFRCVLHGYDKRGDWRFVKTPVRRSTREPLVILAKPVMVLKGVAVPYTRHVFTCESATSDAWRSWSNLRAAVILEDPDHTYDIATLSVPVEKPYRASEYSRKIEFGVCHAIAYNHVDPYRLIEWLEMLRLTGVGKVVFYNSSLQQAESKVLRHYMSDGLVELYQLPPLALPETKQEKRLRQVMALNHCLYRNMHRFQYIIPIDTDEFIMPRTTKNLSSLIREIHRVQLKNNDTFQYHSFKVRTISFVRDEILNPQPDLSKPSYSHFLRYRRRYRLEPWYEHRKAIFLTRSCSVLFMHHCVGTVRGTPSTSVMVDPDLALMHHYRDTSCWSVLANVPMATVDECIASNAKKGKLMLDDSILRFENEILANMRSKMKAIGLQD